MRKVIFAATAAAIATAFGVATTAIAAPTVKNETFSIILTSNTSDVASVIAVGNFTAGGTALLSGGNPKVRFANGTFKLINTGKSKKGTHVNACLYSKGGSGTYKLADGTGAYKEISGSGKFSSTSRQVYPVVKGKCGRTPAAAQFVITATGPVSLP